MNEIATLEPEVVTVELDRTCPACGEIRLVTEYQDAIDGPVFDSCRTCRHGSVMASEADIARVRSMAKRVAVEARGEYIESPHITEINAEMHRLFGGAKGFCQMWYDQIQLAMVNKGGTKLVLEQFKEIARLTKSATEHRDSAPDVARLTDEELGKELLNLVKAAMIPPALEGPAQ